MENTLTTAMLIVNKVTLVAISTAIVWALQFLTTHEDILEAYPLSKSLIFRGGLSLIAVGCVLDFFSIHNPSVTDFIVNLGMLALCIFIYWSWKTGRLVNKSKQKSN